jgi:hypothetical protein
VPHWTLTFDEQDGSQVQVAVGDAMCVQVIRALAEVSSKEEEDGTAPAEDDDAHEVVDEEDEQR